MKRPILSSLLCLAAIHLSGCTLPPGRGPISYVYSDWSTPENLGSVVNTASNDQHPAISPDGLRLYFHSDRPGNITGSTSGTSDIWVTHRDTLTSPWGAPVNLGPTVNSTTNDSAPDISTDGHYLYFGSDRPGGCGLRDIWVSYRANTAADFGADGWQTPANLGCTINSAQNDDGPAFFADPLTNKVTLYFTTQNRANGLGDWDVWASDQKPDGTWTDPVNVTELNTSARDTRTSIRYDGLEMFLTSMRPGSIPDSTNAPSLDLWVSSRSKIGDPWGAPVNMGTTINTAQSDGAPAISADGTELFFYSNKPGGQGANDLYVARRTRTPVFQPGH